MKNKVLLKLAGISLCLLMVCTSLVSCKDPIPPTQTPDNTNIPDDPRPKPTATEFLENGLEYVIDSDISCHIIGIGKFKGSTLEIPAEDGHGRNIAYIDIGAFKKNTEITEVIIPESVREIRQSAFRDCTGIKKITLPDTLQTIGSFAFYGCSSLEKIDLPQSLDKMNEGNFIKCNKLTEINISTENKKFKSEGGVLYNKDMTTLILYPIGKTAESFRVPEGVKTVGNSSFAYCKYIKTVTLASTVENVADHAFRECSALETLNLSEALTRLGVGACYNCKALKTVNYPGTKETWEDEEKMNLTETWSRGAGKYTVNYEWKG